MADRFTYTHPFYRLHRLFSSEIGGLAPSQAQTYAAAVLARLIVGQLMAAGGFLDPLFSPSGQVMPCPARSANDPALLESNSTPSVPSAPLAQTSQGGLFVERVLPYLHQQLGLPRAALDRVAESTVIVPDTVVEQIGIVFSQYHWRFDAEELPSSPATQSKGDDKTISPAMLDRLLEGMIDQKKHGAYFTAADITQHMATKTVIPSLLRRVIAQETTWASTGKAAPAPLFAEGVHAALLASDSEIAEHEDGARALSSMLDMLVSCPVDGRAVMLRVIAQLDDPEQLLSLWRVLCTTTICDPACGTGAMLFAALDVLEPLCAACLVRLEEFPTHPAARMVCAAAGDAAWHRLSILRYLLVHGVFGVDLLEEAVITCQLRLLLRYVQRVPASHRRLFLDASPQSALSGSALPNRLLSLPALDYAIRWGNGLVGYTSLEGVTQDHATTFDQEAAEVQEKTATLVTLLAAERLHAGGTFLPSLPPLAPSPAPSPDLAPPTALDPSLDPRPDPSPAPSPARSPARLRAEVTAARERLVAMLDRRLFTASKADDFVAWHASHRPFHWVAEYADIFAQSSGFEVILGNPPYVALGDLGYGLMPAHYPSTLSVGRAEAVFLERAGHLGKDTGHAASIGFIVKLSVAALGRAERTRQYLGARWDTWYAHFGMRPGRLFPGADVMATIVTAHPQGHGEPNHYSEHRHDGSEHRHDGSEHRHDGSRHCHHGVHPRHGGVFSTGLHLWHQRDRGQLFHGIRYIRVPDPVYAQLGFVPKISDTTACSIVEKLCLIASVRLVSFDASPFAVHYRSTGGRYFKPFSAQPFGSMSATGLASSADTCFYTSSAGHKNVALAVFNSTLYWFWYVLCSDGFNQPRNCLARFPVTTGMCNDRALAALGCEANAALWAGASSQASVHQTTGVMVSPRFRLETVKPVADRIDTALAAHYGFTVDECAYIIDYAIAYRLGRGEGRQQR